VVLRVSGMTDLRTPEEIAAHIDYIESLPYAAGFRNANPRFVLTESGGVIGTAGW